MKLPKLTKSTISVAVAFFLLGYSFGKAETKTTEAVTPTPTVTQENFVHRVIDGDTIELPDGSKVRLIGINAPESTTKKECFGEQAKNKSKKLIEGKQIRLEKDISQNDQYGRLLRYIWVGDEMINEILVRQGYAEVSTFPPDVKYQERFLTAQRLAQTEQIGLWSGVCSKNPTGQ